NMESRSRALKGRAPLNQQLSFWLSLFIVVLVLIIWLKGFYLTDPNKHKHQRPLSVVVIPVRVQDVPIYLHALGTVVPTYTVTIKPQVKGQLLQVFFHEGQQVKQGEVLAEIDTAPYLAQYKQYEGQLLRDKALLANAKLDLQRYQKLWQQKGIAKQTLDT